MNAEEIIAQIKTNQPHTCTSGTGASRIVLSYRPSKGDFRYYKGNRPGGGGKKHITCTEAEAVKLAEGFQGFFFDKPYDVK